MGVITNQAADGFLSRLPEDVQFYLVHGQDEGLIHERTRAIVDRLVARRAGVRADRLDGDAVAKAPGAFHDEACALSLFGEARVFWIDAQGRDLMPALEPLFGRLPDGSVLVVRAGNLKKGVALRSAFETRERALAIECYPDSPDALRALVDREARSAGFEIDRDARDALVDLLGGDRQATRGELAKLTTYAAGRTRLTVEDVGAIVSDAAPSRVDLVLNDVLSGDPKAAAATMSRFFRDDGDIEGLWRALIARLSLLYRLRLEHDRGTPMDGAMRTVGARLPWTSRQAVGDQVRRRSLAQLMGDIRAVRTASARIRAESRLAPLLAARALLALASRSRR